MLPFTDAPLCVLTLARIQAVGYYNNNSQKLGFPGCLAGQPGKPKLSTLSKGCNIQEFLVGDTSVGDGLTLHC
jgi:hypothetical protein